MLVREEEIMTTTQTTGGNAEPVSVFRHGAEWLRVDFHLHTRADDEFAFTGEDNRFVSEYVDALEKAGIRIAVITNHNKFAHDEFAALRSAAKKRGICLLPGVELSVNDGTKCIHTLVVFSDAWLAQGQNHINPFLTVAFEGKAPAEYECANGRSSLPLLETIKKLESYQRDYFLVFAHVENDSGLWHELAGGRLQELGRNELFLRRTLGFQKVRTHDGAGRDVPCRTKVKDWLAGGYPAELEGSDPKAVAEIGQGKPCHLKLGELTFEAVKFALFDHEHRVLQEPPAPKGQAALRCVRFEGALLNSLEVPLSPALNCLIGPRGNGKSAILESVRHALGFPPGSADEKYKTGLVDRVLAPAGKVIVEAVDEFGRDIRVERERSGHPSVFVGGAYREIAPASVLKDILYFGQKDLSSRSEGFDEGFLEKLLADRIDPMPQEEARLADAVRQAARQLRETLDATEKLSAFRREKNELDVQLQVYTDKGVDVKLQEMTVFDADLQAIGAWREAIKEGGVDLKNVAESGEEIASAYPLLKSKLVAPIVDRLERAKDIVGRAKASTGSALEHLRDAYKVIQDALADLGPVQAQLRQDVTELQKTLNEPQLDLNLFRAKMARAEQLRKLLEAGEQRAKTERYARDLVGDATSKLHEFWRERFMKWEEAIRSLEAELPSEIRIRTAFKGKRRAFGDLLRALMRGSGLQATSYDTLVDTFKDGRELYQGRADLEKLLTETAAAKVKAALLEHLADFLMFRTPDVTEILYRGKPLADYSLGQRATVILHILMHLHRHPVILIDQPEDDLDNETLYSHFVRQLVERKNLTQFLFATHNPNIPVLGDAEQVVVCRKEGDAFRFEHGSIDSVAIQKRIVTVMEGGEDAFRRRKEIYQLWKSSN